jgi:hypothetical protein
MQSVCEDEVGVNASKVLSQLGLASAACYEASGHGRRFTFSYSCCRSIHSRVGGLAPIGPSAVYLSASNADYSNGTRFRSWLRDSVWAGVSIPSNRSIEGRLCGWPVQFVIVFLPLRLFVLLSALSLYSATRHSLSSAVIYIQNPHFTALMI